MFERSDTSAHRSGTEGFSDECTYGSTHRGTSRLVKALLRSSPCFAAVLWTCIFVKLFIYDIDVLIAEKFFPEIAWVTRFQLASTLVLVLLLCLVLRWRWVKYCLARKHVRGTILYLIFFPAFVPAKLAFKAAIRHWPIVLALLPEWKRVLRTIRSTLIWTALVALSIIVVALSSQVFQLIVAMCVLGLFVCRQFTLDFRRAFLPSGLCHNSALLLQAMHSALEKSLSDGRAARLKLDDSSEQFRVKYLQTLEVAYVWLNCLQHATSRVQHVIRIRFLDIYLIATVLRTFAIGVLIFAIEYFALLKLDGAAFSPSAAITFIDLLGYSLGLMVNSGVSPVEPISTAAIWVSHAQTICFVLLISVFLSLLVGIAREKHQKELDQVLQEIQSSASRAFTVIQSEFDLTMEEMEQELSTRERQLKTVNDWRRLRGLSPLESNRRSRSSLVFDRSRENHAGHRIHSLRVSARIHRCPSAIRRALVVQRQLPVGVPWPLRRQQLGITSDRFSV